MKNIFLFVLIIISVSGRLSASEKYADLGISYGYTPSLVGMKHLESGDKKTFSYGPVNTLNLNIGAGFFFPGRFFEKTGMFMDYNYSFMKESDFQSIIIGPEIKFLYYFKGAFGIGYTYYNSKIPVDDNSDLKKDYSTSFDLSLSIGMEFNLSDDLMIGFGYKLLPIGTTGSAYYNESKYGTFYVELSKNLF